MCAYERIKVLIETYWNVKSDRPGENWSSDAVLIETYWNVKKSDEMVTLLTFLY